MSKRELIIDPPLMNAAGTSGFAPNPHGPVDLSAMGAFVTNPISLDARSPAHGERVLSHPGGVLIHTGHPNPGLRNALARYAHQWARSPLPVIVHLLPTEPAELQYMVLQLEDVEGIAGIEVELPPEVDTLSGRLYGPSMFPMTLATTRALAQIGFPVIAAGVVYHAREAVTLLKSGAVAVQLDTVFWRTGGVENLQRNT